MKFKIKTIAVISLITTAAYAIDDTPQCPAAHLTPAALMRMI